MYLSFTSVIIYKGAFHALKIHHSSGYNIYFNLFLAICYSGDVSSLKTVISDYTESFSDLMCYINVIVNVNGILQNFLYSPVYSWNSEI